MSFLMCCKGCVLGRGTANQNEAALVYVAKTYGIFAPNTRMKVIKADKNSQLETVQASWGMFWIGSHFSSTKILTAGLGWPLGWPITCHVYARYVLGPAFEDQQEQYMI